MSLTIADHARDRHDGGKVLSISSGIPDMRFINRELRIADVARALELRLDGTAKIHCWHPERHQHGDRTASVGIRASNNTVKCFGCDSKPMGPIDLVMEVRGLQSSADAAIWIAARFKVPTIPARKPLKELDRWRGCIGREEGMELLIRSGLFGRLSEPAREIAPALWSLREKDGSSCDEYRIQISYGGIARYSGVCSPNAIRKGLQELAEIAFLRLPERTCRRSPEREATIYVLTPNSSALWELAQHSAAEVKMEIAAERELRARLRRDRIRATKDVARDLGRTLRA